jgi:hypothetical protein
MIKRQGEGIPGRDGLLHQIKQPQDNFRVAIRRTVPCFVPQYRNESSDAASLAAPSHTGSERNSFDAVDSKTAYTEVVFAPHTYPQFLVGEEDSKEIGLNDGKEVFIDDVLETAEWCVPWLCSVNLAHNKYFDQCSHTRVTKQLSFYSPEGVHPHLRLPMG